MEIILKRLPQPFTEAIFGISTDELISTLDDNFRMFKLLIVMLKSSGIKMHRLLFVITHKDCRGEKIEISVNKENFSNFCHINDTLLSLFYYYYNSTLYILNDYKSAEYLELLID